jgi:hypothetical protein
MEATEPQEGEGMAISLPHESQALTPDEQADLQQQEAIIAQGLQTFWEVGQALMVIRDRRLYRQQHPSFEAYLQQQWQLSRFYAHRLIESAAVREQLLPIGNNLPENEAQVRPLARLKDPEARRQAWQAAIDQAAAEGKPVTAALVRAVVAQHAPAAPTPPPSIPPPSRSEPQTIAEAEQLLLESARRYGKASREERAAARRWLLQAAERFAQLEEALRRASRGAGPESPAPIP